VITGYLSRDELYAALKQYGGDVHMDIEQVLAEVDKVCIHVKALLESGAAFCCNLSITGSDGTAFICRMPTAGSTSTSSPP
jgi:hypothetical protein